MSRETHPNNADFWTATERSEAGLPVRNMAKFRRELLSRDARNYLAGTLGEPITQEEQTQDLANQQMQAAFAAQQREISRAAVAAPTTDAPKFSKEQADANQQAMQAAAETTADVARTSIEQKALLASEFRDQVDRMGIGRANKDQKAVDLGIAGLKFIMETLAATGVLEGGGGSEGDVGFGESDFGSDEISNTKGGGGPIQFSSPQPNNESGAPF